ncbi:MAG: hypothetical protein WC156_13890, partial [Pedobacter sp.]
RREGKKVAAVDADKGRQPGIIDPAGGPEYGPDKAVVPSAKRHGLDYPCQVEWQMHCILHCPRRRMLMEDEWKSTALNNLHQAVKI